MLVQPSVRKRGGPFRGLQSQWLTELCWYAFGSQWATSRSSGASSLHGVSVYKLMLVPNHPASWQRHLWLVQDHAQHCSECSGYKKWTTASGTWN